MFNNLSKEDLQALAARRNIPIQGKNTKQLAKDLERHEQRIQVSTKEVIPPAAPAKKGMTWQWALIGAVAVVACVALAYTAIMGVSYGYDWLQNRNAGARAAVSISTSIAPDLQATINAMQSQPTQAAGPQATPTPALQPIPGERDPNACINKLYTYPANTAGVMYDFEVQSGVVQMNDFYTPGNPTIIVLEQAIMPEERSAYALGWGSAWGLFSDRLGCKDFDMVADAIRYAEARLDQGHAGLVVDFRSSAVVSAMLEGMTHERANELWEMYVVAGHDSGRTLPAELTFPDDIVMLQPPSPEALAASGVCKAEEDRAIGVSEVNGEKVVVMGPWDQNFVNVQGWFGKAENSPEPDNHFNFIVPSGVTIVIPFEATDFKGGGRWNYTSCSYEQMVTDLQWSGLNTWHIEEINGRWAWMQGPIPQELAEKWAEEGAAIQPDDILLPHEVTQ